MGSETVNSDRAEDEAGYFEKFSEGGATDSELDSLLDGKPKTFHLIAYLRVCLIDFGSLRREVASPN